MASKKSFIRRYNSATPQNVVFGIFTSDEIKKLSVVKISTPLTFTSLGHTLPGGLYDPALGPSQQGIICATCSNSIFGCRGHMGHIDLPFPVVNALFYSNVIAFLSCSCLSCHRILFPEARKVLLIAQLKLLDRGHVVQAMEIEQIFSHAMSMNEGLSEEAFAAIVSGEIDKQTEVLMHDEVKTVEDWKQVEVLRNQFINNIKHYIFKGKNCPKCKEPWKKLKTVKKRIMIEAKLEVANKFKNKTSKSGPELTPIREGGFVYLLPSESMVHLRAIWANEEKLMKEIVPVLKSVSGPHPTDLFFMTVVPVTPINARPVNFVGGTVVEHPQNYVYKLILQDCLVIRSIVHLMNTNKETNNENDLLSSERIRLIEQLKGSNLSEKLQISWHDLQKHCDTLLDKSLGSGSTTAVTDGLGLKQLIEKKEGIIRMHMMGKRVNFAARSVITPDPNLNIDEIGIPDRFAKKLTYPVPVTAWNVEELRKMVMNGPNIHPGAVLIENEEGFTSRISADDVTIRESIAKTLLTPDENSLSKGVKIVHRHLLNGDILLLNRQPTLHRPSIMGHKARILKGDKTLRLHYANCKAYNADFDGDEMNAHFPQNELARSEAYNLVNVSKQYLVPKDGTPLSGLIQDHVISGVRLTMRDSFFTREDYMNLVFQALSFIHGDIKTLPPAILKPVALWSGKQILSTVIINLTPRGKTPLNLTSSAKISYKAWEKGPARPWLAGGTPFSDPKIMTEAEVVIRGGELLCGVLDKTHYGATPYSLVHCVYELYGSQASSQLLSSFAKLFNAFLQIEGFTLGVEDILVVKKADKERLKHIKAVRKIGTTAAAKALDLPEDTPTSELKQKIGLSYRKDPKFRGQLDHQYKKCLDTYTNNINQACLPSGLLSLFPNNNLQLMVQSGAKGSTVNTMQISCLLGQIELEGKRPPIMLSGRSLPSFPPYELSPRAGGFIDGRFMTGIQPQEFFFHCMAGREGLIDTAVKTSRSGYLQRCLVKHLEGLTVHYDLTVRDSDNSIVQFRYGEDAMEVMKSQFLNKDQINFLADNLNNVLDKKVVEQLKSGSDNGFIERHMKKMKTWKKKHQDQTYRRSGFTLFSEEMSLQHSEKSHKKINKKHGRSKAAVKISKMWCELDEESKKR
ncbi:DNA-directed RNA polymerase I subunit RPA1 [Homalodisca vitripennis]|nr:DNA-directed RNA polymerase I subunit RPA1 [Homalodisca vitripennis]